MKLFTKLGGMGGRWAGVAGLGLLTVAVLRGAGTTPAENFAPQGTMQSNLDAGGHNVTNVGTVSATNVVVSGSLSAANLGSAATNAASAFAPASGSANYDAAGAAATAQAFAIQRANQTGTQAATTITGLSPGATNAAAYQAPIALTTTGTSGAASFNGGTLNVPQYAGANYTAGAGLSLNTGVFSVNYGTGSGTAAQGNDARLTGALQASALGTGVQTALGNAVNAAGGVVTSSNATLTGAAQTASLLSAPVYVGVNFNYDFSNTCAGSIGISTDAIHWSPLFGFENYCGDGAYPSVRDPSITRINGTWYVCYTAAIGLTCSPYLAIAKSQDLVNWTLAGDISLTGISGANGVISPKWFTDPTTGNVYVNFYNFSVTNGLNVFHTQLTNAATINFATAPTFGTPVAFTTLGTGITWVDACMIYANGVYNLFARDNTAGYYHKFTATTFAGNYTDASGAITNLGTGEGLTVFNGPGGLYWAEITIGVTNWSYATSSDLSTWTTLSPTTPPPASFSGTRANWDNGSVLPILDAASIRDVLLAGFFSSKGTGDNVGQITAKLPHLNMLGTQGSAGATVTVTDTARIKPGMGVTGTNIPTGDFVLAVPSATTVTLYLATTTSLGSSPGSMLTFGASSGSTNNNAATTLHLGQYGGDEWFLEDNTYNSGAHVLSYVVGSGLFKINTALQSSNLTAYHVGGNAVSNLGHFGVSAMATNDVLDITGGLGSTPTQNNGWQIRFTNVGGSGSASNTVRFGGYNVSGGLTLDGHGSSYFNKDNGQAVSTMTTWTVNQQGTGDYVRVLGGYNATVNGTPATNNGFELGWKNGGGVGSASNTAVIGVLGSNKLASVDGNGNLSVQGLIAEPTFTPASSSAAGTTGQIAWDANFLYVCTGANTWKRVAIATW